MCSYPPKVIRVFISHAAQSDKDIAEKLESWIAAAYQSYEGLKVKTFVSSTDGIDVGDAPFDTIKTELNRSDVLIALLSKEAKYNRWIAFEAGVMFGRGVRVIPITCKGTSANDFSGPIKDMFELKNAADEDEFTSALAILDGIIGKPHKKGTSSLQKNLSCTQAPTKRMEYLNAKIQPAIKPKGRNRRKVYQGETTNGN